METLIKSGAAKPRLLLVNEFSQLATGYSVYGFEVQKRLFQSGKYEIAELATVVAENDFRTTMSPWKVYANFPADPNGREAQEYHSKTTNQFGEFRFENTCLRFKPDIVWSFRDFWMDEFIERSPFRRFYKWAMMPTVDAVPQHEQWLATFMGADAVFTYSDWATEVLKRDGGGLIRTCGSAPPGADLDTFQPMDKAALRTKFHFENDVFIVGTVMRNQPRKLYPNLIQAFADFLTRAPRELASKTYLYLHTSYPDQGWDIPRLIKRYGISSRTLVTYKCRRCHAVFPSFFRDANTACEDCGHNSASMPNTQQGVDRGTLAKIINLFDVYVQYANSEGFGMPQVEAASCGVTVFSTDYSAMSDVVRKVSGYPIRVASYNTDSDFGCLRAVPDNADFVDKLIKYLSKSPPQRLEESKKARRGVENHYTWERTTEKWMEAFDRLAGTGESAAASCRWDSPPTTHTPLPVPKTFGTNEELVRWCIKHVLGQPEKVDSYLALRLIRDLNWGKSMKNITGTSYANESSYLATMSNMQAFTTDHMVAELTAMCEHRNLWENRRWQMLTPDSR